MRTIQNRQPQTCQKVGKKVEKKKKEEIAEYSQEHVERIKTVNDPEPTKRNAEKGERDRVH